MPENCPLCRNHCDLSAPKCDRGRRLAQEIAQGTYDPEQPQDGRELSSESHHGHHHGGHGGHHH